ncbi:MAG: hypothetical protein MSIBF_03695 [Candidatus Altiarchaeales archaeon IMC4]|nr:MAG: hypothetical protein MSIBF_03695 [Candidatus Altiarchaeales archaeon IMC4]
MKHLSGFKFYDQKLVDKNMVIIADVTGDAHLRGIELQTVSGIMSMIRSLIKEHGAKRAVIDSITAICDGLGTDQKRRDFVLELGFQLSYLGCTTIMVSEIPPQTFVYSVFGVEEFVSDGIILLTEFERKANLIRTLQVVKMRGVNHSRTKQVLEITKDGIKLLPMFEE